MSCFKATWEITILNVAYGVQVFKKFLPYIQIANAWDEW